MANVCMSTASVNAVARPKLPRIAAARASTSAGAQLLRRLPGRSLRLSAAPFPAAGAKRYVFCKNQANSVDSISANNVQEMSVYEINEEDRGSPAYLRLSQKDVSSIGDLAPFTNKLYTGDLKKRAGITAGICIFIKHEPEKKGDRYEAIYSFYLGDYGHISVQGAYLTYQTTYLAVKGGSGVFEGASGQAKLNQISPKAGLITFYLKGIPQLPPELLGEVVPPSPNVEPAAAAKACAAGATLPKFTD